MPCDWHENVKCKSFRNYAPSSGTRENYNRARKTKSKNGCNTQLIYIYLNKLLFIWYRFDESIPNTKIISVCMS